MHWAHRAMFSVHCATALCYCTSVCHSVCLSLSCAVSNRLNGLRLLLEPKLCKRSFPVWVTKRFCHGEIVLVPNAGLCCFPAFLSHHRRCQPDVIVTRWWQPAPDFIYNTWSWLSQSTDVTKTFFETKIKTKTLFFCAQGSLRPGHCIDDCITVTQRDDKSATSHHRFLPVLYVLGYVKPRWVFNKLAWVFYKLIHSRQWFHRHLFHGRRRSVV